VLDDLPPIGWHEIAVPASEPSDAEWKSVLGDAPRTHRLSYAQLEQAGRALDVLGGDLDAAVRRLVGPKLDQLARRIRPRHTWDDLVLPPAHAAQLRDIVDRYRLASTVYDEWGFPAVPSAGLVALFSGPSGTGKTLAAEVVAGELGLDLYKLDLSSIVSKWVGETEKNLDELFEAAGAGNLVLFFDEADALFSKRSEVADSHDRYANLETSYLLQRLESYHGVVVMATNYEKNIDQAFMRRIHARIDFALPDEAERRMIWHRHLQAGAPLADDIDVEWLARHFELPGAAIRNAVIDAAFHAAATTGTIDMASLVGGVARELRKLGRLVRKEDFGRWFATVDTV
jgi:SpoVK/Ycf46/Vps4 family AAA+-type ATPase